MGVLATRNKIGVKNNVGVNSVHCTLKSSLEHTITTKKETDKSARCISFISWSRSQRDLSEI